MVNLDSKTNIFLTRHWSGVAALAILCSVVAAYIFGWLQAPASLISSLPWAGSGNARYAGYQAGGTNPGSQAGGVNQPPATPSKQSPASFDEYKRRLKSLSDRFLEKNEYINQNSGALVEWDGVVTSVRGSKSGLIISLDSRSIEFVGQNSGFLVDLPETFRTKAFSLQPGDVVRVKGTLDLTTPSFPVIEGSELALVELRGKK